MNWQLLIVGWFELSPRVWLREVHGYQHRGRSIWHPRRSGVKNFGARVYVLLGGTLCFVISQITSIDSYWFSLIILYIQFQYVTEQS